MVARIFYTIPEAIEYVGGSKELLRELVEFHGLKFYVKLKSEKAYHVDYEGFFEDTLCSPGEHQHSSWRYSIINCSQDEIDDAFHPKYTLHGWFELNAKSSAHAIEVATNFLEIAQFTSYKNNKPLGDFTIYNSRISADDLRVKVKDIAGIINNSAEIDPINVKPAKLRSDREESLLKVIAVLWHESKLPKEHNVAADRLAGIMSAWGWDKPATNTIADTILKNAASIPKNK